MAKTVDDLMNEAFGDHRARDPRSAEYKQGCRHLLNRRMNGGSKGCPYKAGTVQFDAFYAGVDEGITIWKAYQDELKMMADAAAEPIE
jgi:hypothetical protein